MRVLVVDDDAGLRQSLTLLLQQADYEVVAEGSPTRALERARNEPFDVVLCDVRMPEMEGLEFLRRYRQSQGPGLVIMMSAYGREDAAIEAMKQGAYDYLPKPFRSDEVLLTLGKAEERERLRTQVATLTAELTRATERNLVAESPPMRKVLDLATRVAPHPTTVLITGESGTGKEVVARAVHRMSPRREARFVAINCGAIPENLLESELFGHSRGAFTGATGDKRGLFEDADGGSLLLDEVGDLPLPLQVKLLRVLQEGEIRRVGDSRPRRVDVRVIAATARDLEGDIGGGRFREDLYYRLNVVRIHIPPLRERPQDLEPLVAVLLKRAMDRAGRLVTLSPDGLAAIRALSWPGNVRELENAIERAVVLSADGVIRGEAFEAVGRTGGRAVSWSSGQGGAESAGPAESPDRQPARPPVRLDDAVTAAEREAIRAALGATGGNRTEAARILGISPRNLFYKLKKLNVD